jgi:3-oxoacyl-[acyl-carrier-protein] synthase-1
MRRVAITGIGIVSSIGNNVSEVTNSLRNGTSGIVAAPNIRAWIPQSGAWHRQA